MSYNTSGDKLMQLRKKYGIKQYELAGEHISRSYIGMVEQNRRKITRNKAEEITKNFNNLLKGKNIEIKLEDFFVETEEEMSGKAEQIIKLIKEKVYSDKFLAELKELESEIIQNTSQNKALIYFEIGERLYENNEFISSAFYFEKALEYFLTNKQIKEISLIGEKLSECYLNIERYNELDILYFRLRPFLDKIKTDSKNLMLFNFAKGFKELKEYKESLKLLDNVKIAARDYQRKNEVFSLMAENYQSLNRLSEAEFYYEKITEKAAGLDFIKATLKILELKKEQRIPRREIKKTYTKIKKILSDEENVCLSEYELYEIAKISVFLDEKNDALGYLKEALEKSSASEVSEEIIELKIGLYDEMGNKAIKHIESRFIDMLTKKYSTKLMASFSRFYLQNEMFEENQEFIDRVYLKLNEKRK